MSIGSKSVLNLLRNLMSPSSKTRSLAADSVTDWLTGFNDEELLVVLQTLALLAVSEMNEEARESQLHALAEANELNPISSHIRTLIGRIQKSDLKGSSLEHFDYLMFQS